MGLSRAGFSVHGVELGEQENGDIELLEQGLHFAAREYVGEVLRTACVLKAVEPSISIRRTLR